MVTNEIKKWQNYSSLVPSITNRSQKENKTSQRFKTSVSHKYKHLAMTSEMGQHYLAHAFMMEDLVFTTWKWEAERQGKCGSSWNWVHVSSGFYQQFYALQVVNKNGDIQTCILHHNNPTGSANSCLRCSFPLGKTIAFISSISLHSSDLCVPYSQSVSCQMKWWGPTVQNFKSSAPFKCTKWTRAA